MARLLWTPKGFNAPGVYTPILDDLYPKYRVFRQQQNHDDLSDIDKLIKDENIKSPIGPMMATNLVSPPVASISFQAGGNMTQNKPFKLRNAANVQFFVAPVFAFKVVDNQSKTRAKWAEQMSDLFPVAFKQSKGFLNNVSRYADPDAQRQGVGKTLLVSKSESGVFVSNKIPLSWTKELISILAKRKNQRTSRLLATLFFASVSTADETEWFKLVKEKSSNEKKFPDPHHTHVFTFPNTFRVSSRLQYTTSMLAGSVTRHNISPPYKDKVFATLTHPAMFIYVNLSSIFADQGAFEHKAQIIRSVIKWSEMKEKEIMKQDYNQKKMATVRLISVLVPMLLNNRLDVEKCTKKCAQNTVPMIALLSCPGVIVMAARAAGVPLDFNTTMLLIRKCVKLTAKMRRWRITEVCEGVTRISLNGYADILTLVAKTGSIWDSAPFTTEDVDARNTEIESINQEFLKEVSGGDLNFGVEEKEQQEEKEESQAGDKRPLPEDAIVVHDPKKRKMLIGLAEVVKSDEVLNALEGITQAMSGRGAKHTEAVLAMAVQLLNSDADTLNEMKDILERDI